MKLFGTDGIRGRANEFPITAEVALRVGKDLANSPQRCAFGDREHRGAASV